MSRKCARCSGSGTIDCPRCDGNGKTENSSYIPVISELGTFVSSEFEQFKECSKCSGTGEVACPACDGAGEV